jgi:hypothetical protein
MTASEAVRPGGKLPGSVTFLAVGSLVFSALGLIGGGLGLLTTLTQRHQWEELAGSAGGGLAMFHQMAELQAQLFLPSLATHAIFVFAGLLSGAVGVLVLLRHGSAPMLGPLLLGAVALLWVLGTAFEAWIQHQTMGAMAAMVSGFGADPAAAGALGPTLDRFIGISRAFTYGCLGGWLLIKISFVAWAALHLRSPDVVRLFGGSWTPGTRGD